MRLVLLTFFVCSVFQNTLGHSTMTEPQSISPGTCRLGGEPQFGVLDCAGPCDLSAIEGEYPYSNHGSSQNPARVYRRGEQTRIKYQRNNHAPGGFIRLTLVTPDQMMNKEVHKRNAFHYSCWGAKPVIAAEDELNKDRFGFTMIGSDGEQHSVDKGYYVMDVTIPECVPDGDYVMGWVWYGGTGGNVETNEPQEPVPWGYFGDYWSCSFVRIEGGAPLAPSCDPVFVNDMSQFSQDGCMSANDEPGICTYEPCKVDGYYQKPKSFKNAGQPPPITPENFGVSYDKSVESNAPKETPDDIDLTEAGNSSANMSYITPSPVSAEYETFPSPSLEIFETEPGDGYPEHSMEQDYTSFD